MEFISTDFVLIWMWLFSLMISSFLTPKKKRKKFDFKCIWFMWIGNLNGYGEFDLRFTWICCLCCYDFFSQENIIFFLIGPLLGAEDWALKWPDWAGPGGVGLGLRKKTCLINGLGLGRGSGSENPSPNSTPCHS